MSDRTVLADRLELEVSQHTLLQLRCDIKRSPILTGQLRFHNRTVGLRMKLRSFMDGQAFDE